MDQRKPELKALVVETEEIYRYMYEHLPAKGRVILAGVLDEFDKDIIRREISNCHPDVFVLGTKTFDSNIIEELHEIRLDYPNLGMVLLFASCSDRDIACLRKLAGKGQGGVALVLKHSLQRTEQLANIITAVNYGQIILDPALASLMLGDKVEYSFLKQLTPKELENLSLLARGYTNEAIAEALFIDIKTVEHHLNSIYSRLRSESDLDGRHLRVAATRLYLQQIGELNPEMHSSLINKTSGHHIASISQVGR